jgi:PKD repeat protein
MMLKGKIFLILFAVAILPLVSASILINEFEQNPPGADSGNEWIELYNTAPTFINISGFTITNGDNDSLSFNGSISANGYFLINLTTQWLDNSDENISLFNGTELIDRTVTASDSSDDTRAWARCPNGRADSNWSFVENTPNTTNNCPSPNQLPIANFTYSPASPIANQNVTFDASSSYDADGNITLYSWNFGDGGNATGVTAQHNFTTAGSFTINLTVTDSNSSQSSITKAISVSNPPSQPQNCSFEVTSAPAEAYFGSIININISVYRNNTDKYAVYLYIEDNEGEDVTDTITFHATPNKSANYTFNASVEIYKKCNVTNKTFAIIVRGLDEKISKPITLKENSTLCLPDFQYAITPVTTAKINETFSTRIKITNNRNTDKRFDVWSYVYRGSKCYSCVNETQENLNRVLVDAYSSSEILLYNAVKDAEAGDYSLKVKILKENTDTPLEYTFDITLEAAGQQNQTTESNLNAQNLTNETGNKTLGEEKKFKFEFNKKYIWIALIVLCISFAAYLLIRKKLIAVREYGV